MIATFAHPNLEDKTFKDLTNARTVTVLGDDLGSYSLTPTHPLPAKIAADYASAVRKAWHDFQQGKKLVTV